MLRLYPVPGQQLVQPGSRLIGDAAQHIGEPGLRIDGVEFGRGNQGIDRGGALAATVRRDLMMPGVWDTR
jgi:hypothetical protein